MSLHDRVAAIPGGERALASSRLRRAIIKVLHQAFRASPLESQAELAKRLRVRRSAVNQVLRGDGNVRVSTLAEYLYEMGYELNVTLVRAGELRAAELDGRPPAPAFASASASASIQYGSYAQSSSQLALWCGRAPSWGGLAVMDPSATSQFFVLLSSYRELGATSFSTRAYESIDLSDELAKSGAA